MNGSVARGSNIRENGHSKHFLVTLSSSVRSLIAYSVVVPRVSRIVPDTSATADGPQVDGAIMGRGLNLVVWSSSPSRRFSTKSHPELPGDGSNAPTRNVTVVPHAWDVGTLRDID